MEKSYKILRVNEDTKTITVMLRVNGKELQQDVDYVGTKKEFKDIIKQHLDKLAADLKDRADEITEKAPDFDFVIGQEMIIE